jgi:Tfp pilus assembly protein PilF
MNRCGHLAPMKHPTMATSWHKASARILGSFAWLLVSLALALALALGSQAWATPIQVQSDADVIETLPLHSAARQQDRRLRQNLAQHPQNVTLALQAAQTHLDQAHQQGDARFAGLALGALAAWDVPANTAANTSGTPAIPTEVLVTKATVLQYLHDFDGAQILLRRALKQAPRHAQAWITLATIHRVQGRYADSDQACAQVGASGAALYGEACLAENQSLRGQQVPARQRFKQLLASPSAQGPAGSGLRQWLWTSMAELEERAGQSAAAEAAWKQALAEGANGYVRMAWADFLLQQQRPREVLRLLAGGSAVPAEAEADAPLLRLAIAASQAGDARADAWQTEQARRFAASAARPEAARTHAREQALFALRVAKQPELALRLAQDNLRQQREPIDLLIMADAARAQAGAAQRRAALQDLQTLTRSMGVHDARLNLP